MGGGDGGGGSHGDGIASGGGLFGGGGGLLSGIHTALDLGSFVPGLATVTSLANAALYAAEGNYTDAALAALVAIPVAGAAVLAARVGLKALKAAKARRLARPGEDLFVGTYNESRAANLASGLNATHTPHHVVQAAVSLASSRGTGITVNLNKGLHAVTRTFRRPVDATLNLRTHLARDIRDLRGILSGAGYNRGVINRQLQELIRQNKGLGGFGK
jgi:hypothetical protein